jgi:Leucine-rich repeat (LRR) protein
VVASVHWQSYIYFFLEFTAAVEGFVTNKQDLDLSSNLISSLPATVFANSPLSSLSLANNSLTALQPKLFSGLSNLLHLGKLFNFLLSFAHLC